MGANDRIKEYLKTLTTTHLEAGGILQPEQADRFLDLTLEYSTLLSQVRNEGKTRSKGQIDTLNVGSVVTTPAATPHKEVDWSNVFGKVEYSMERLRSAFDLDMTALLENIESEMRGGTPPPAKQPQGGQEPRGDFRETLMRAFARRISTDYELLWIQGDTDLPEDPNDMQRTLLRCNDGILKIAMTAPTCHIVDAGSKNISVKLFEAMLEAMPSPYLKNPADLRWIVGPRLNIRWTSKLAERQTALGDEVIKGMSVAPFGIPMIMAPLMPEDHLVGTVGNHGYIILTYLQNLVYIYRRHVEMYWEFKPREDVWQNTTYSETDALIENKNCMVLATNVKVDAPQGYGE